MGYKFETALKKSKWIIIIGIAIWLTLTILLSAPVAIGIVDTKGDLNNVFGRIIELMPDIGANIFTAIRPRIYRNIYKSRSMDNFSSSYIFCSRIY